MSSRSTEAQTYDAVPFPVQPVPPSDPDRLAAVAMLFGMRPQRVDRARVLELGCASGGNLLPLAERFPESTFVGVDFSEVQIATARRGALALGLTNVEVRAASIMEIDERLGTFDYIIAHGFYSWVGPEVQRQMLKLCKALLAPHGVAYASYNTYPGWCFPNIVRELVCGCASPDDAIQHRLAEARKLLRFFSETMQRDATPYAQLLRAEIDRVLDNPDGYLAHEHMGEHNDPVYFYEFVSRAAEAGLQYVADSLVHTMFVSNLGAVAERSLAPLARDPISAEQHIDLMRNRAFRMSILCHDDVALARRLVPECLRGLYFSGRFRLANPAADLNSQADEQIVTPGGSVISTRLPDLKVAVDELGRRWPASVTVEGLADAVARRLSSGSPPMAGSGSEALASHLLELLRAGYLQPHSQPDAFVPTVSERPRANPLARAQAALSTGVTNRRHEMVRLDEVSQNLLRYLDGEHDHAALVEVLLDAVDRGELSILVNGMPIQRGAPATDILGHILERSLAALAADGLLIA